MADVDGFDFRPELYYTEDHVWLKVESDGNVRVGFDDIIAKGSHEIFYLKLVDSGLEVAFKKKLGVIESRKYSGPIPSPVAGTVVSVNPKAVKEGVTFFMDHPYDDGWLVTLKASNLEVDLKKLLHGDAALEWFKKAAEPLKEELEIFKMKHGE